MPDPSQHQWEINVPTTLLHQALRLQFVVVQSFINSLNETSRAFFHLACDNAPSKEPQERAKYLQVTL